MYQRSGVEDTIKALMLGHETLYIYKDLAWTTYSAALRPGSELIGALVKIRPGAETKFFGQGLLLVHNLALGQDPVKSYSTR